MCWHRSIGFQIFFLNCQHYCIHTDPSDFFLVTIILGTEKRFWLIWGILGLPVSNQGTPKMPTRVFLYVECSLFICFSFFNESLEKCINDIMLLLPFSTSKESKMVKFQNFNFFLIFFLSNFDVTFCNLFIFMGYWWTIIKTNLAILFQKRSKRSLNYEILHI